MYYLQSRYYDPEIGRFLNADSIIAGIGDCAIGYNLFAYCFNNPANMLDYSGHWCQLFEDASHWFEENIIQPIEEFFEDIAEDVENYDNTNEDEDVVFSSNYISCYKGVLVIKTPFDASFSYGFIGLSSSQQYDDILRHEYGHTVQLENMGWGSYITEVAVPSLTINLLDRQRKLQYDYYSYPWEAEANRLGEATLSQAGKQPVPPGEEPSFWDLIKLFWS